MSSRGCLKAGVGIPVTSVHPQPPLQHIKMAA